MDGRSHLSKHARHTAAGFTTGVWNVDMLTAYTTHLKVGTTWRNGVPHSDQATLTEHFVRHGDFLTLMSILEDPIYLEEPFVRTATWQRDVGVRILAEACEPQLESPRAAGEVPHYLPGANPYLSEFADSLNLPREAVRGGAATTFPEYRKRLNESYVAPEKCSRFCSMLELLAPDLESATGSAGEIR